MKKLISIVALASVLAGWAQYAFAASSGCIPTSQGAKSSDSSDWSRSPGSETRDDDH
jgi:hypothetical protein